MRSRAKVSNVCAGLYMRAAFRNDGTPDAAPATMLKSDGDESDSVCVSYATFYSYYILQYRLMFSILELLW